VVKGRRRHNNTGSVDITGREGSIEIHGLHHGVSVTTDNYTGKSTATREHAPCLFSKEIDASSIYLYKSVTTGQKLQSAEVKFYRINDTGQEVEYFIVLMEGVRIVTVGPMMFDIKSSYGEKRNHLEMIELVYEKSPGAMWMEILFIQTAGMVVQPHKDK